jgi:hypothetical protein
MIETFHEFKKENNVFEFMLIRIPAYYKKISCNELRKKIKDHGQIPAPITPQTKMLYVKKNSGSWTRALENVLKRIPHQSVFIR